MVRQALKFLFALSAAASVTAIVFFIDSERLLAQNGASALSLARQTAYQAGGLVYGARARGERDPVGAAAEALSQGVEPRMIFVSKVRSGSRVDTQEYSRLDAGLSLLEYTKILTPEDGTGVRVKVVVPYAGFLGARSPFEQDLTLLGFFGLFFALCWALASGGVLRFGAAHAREEGPTLQEQRKPKVEDWAVRAREGLAELGSRIREVIRHAGLQAKAAARSHSYVASLRNRMHGALEEVHQGRGVLSDARVAVERAQVAAMTAATTVHSLGPEARPVLVKILRLKQKIEEIKVALERGSLAMERVESQVEPWVTDADLAFHAHGEIAALTGELREKIQRTSASLRAQSRLIEGFAEERAPAPSAADQVSEPRRGRRLDLGSLSGEPISIKDLQAIQDTSVAAADEDDSTSAA